MNQLKEALAYIQSRTDLAPQIGIILGTGLGNLVNHIDITCSIDYKDIPHFPISTVETHSGKLIFGHLEGKAIVAMQGRFHFYEGYSMQQVTYPVRVMKLLGIEKLLISNIAGGINPNYELADLMIIEDHINLQPDNPLLGINIDELGPRWPDMFEAYDRNMIDSALKFGKEQAIPMHEGVYVSVVGPNLETRAEYRYLARIGADAVGMSTVPEVIVARHMNIPVFAVSVISDLCYAPLLKPANILELLEAADTAQPRLTALFSMLVREHK